MNRRGRAETIDGTEGDPAFTLELPLGPARLKIASFRSGNDRGNKNLR
jgi:hypothetical protein